MPILFGDIVGRFSGGAANSNPAASLGGAISNVGVGPGLFDDVPSAESTPGDVEYRCFYVRNNHATLTMLNAIAWISANTPGNAIAIGSGTAGVNGTEQTVANENTAPSGVTFSQPSTKGAGIALGNIPPGQFKSIWIRRTVGAGAAAANALAYSIAIEGDSSTEETGSRNVLQQPFATSSIWNMPIGSGATYVNALMTSVFADPFASMPYADEDVIILTPSAPATQIRQGNWAGDRCSPISGTVYATVPIPTNYTNPSSNHNLASAVLAADGRTLVNVQPLTRCTAGQPATAIVRWPDSDIYGDGIDGAHGGSGMSSIGGTLRVGEMRPGDVGVPHAIKLIVYMKEAHRGLTYADCYRWPAKAADGYAVGWYGQVRAGPTDFKMGALMAILPSVNIDAIGLETVPGRKLAWTLQNYGGYVVDDSYGGQFGIATERGPNGIFVDQFQADYGHAFWVRQNATGSAAAWMRDVQRCVSRLHIVSNNGPSNIGGGGTPRQPLAPPVSP